MRLLHIDSSIMGAGSVSRELSAAIVAQLRKKNDYDVTYHDLVAEAPPHLTLATLPWDHPVSAKAGKLDAAAKAIRNESQSALDAFVAADAVVIGAAMYNFTVASQLKAWIDRIVVPERTFRYGESGPEGLCGDKRVIVAVARGSVYGPEPFPSDYEHAETYLRTVLAFIGIDAPEIIVAEGLMTGPDNRTRALADAHATIERLAA